MNKTPQTLKGFRDFLPKEKRKRNFIAGKFIQTFEQFGFEPIETPTLEYASLLLGKYGKEADKLVYTFKDKGDREVGLRYDQTVPATRILSQYQSDIPKFFRRYQIQNVFRADKPQKGRYREFTSADLDIFHSTDPIADAEILACTYFALKSINYPTIVIKINDRKSLIDTLTPFATDEIKVHSIIQSIDKLDKLDQAEVAKELVSKGLASEQATQALETIQASKPTDNLKQIIQHAIDLGVHDGSLRFEPTLARGLDYYTGMIFEITIPEYTQGSLGGGGRYDQLIQDLGGPFTPAVGVGLGFDRLVEAADQLELIPHNISQVTVLVTVFDSKTTPLTLKVASHLRSQGIAVEVFPKKERLARQFKLASLKKIPYVLVVGQREVEQNLVTLKDMSTGEQTSLTLEEAVSKLKS